MTKFTMAAMTLKIAIRPKRIGIFESPNRIASWVPTAFSNKTHIKKPNKYPKRGIGLKIRSMVVRNPADRTMAFD
jgi:hypothetical protein